MNEVIEQLIADFHERPLPDLTRRDARLPWLAGKIDSVVGMRRAGKTWFVYQTIGDLLAGGWPKKSLLYLNFEDERLWPFAAKDLQRIVDVYYRRYPLMRERECAFFLDEIHAVDGWERFVRRLVDTENVHICLIGSSAKLLSAEIATSLRGRSITTEVFPFGFAESLSHAGIDTDMDGRPGKVRRSLFEGRLRDYLLAGGFPEVQAIDQDYRRRILQGYLDVVILRDLIERHKITNTVSLRSLIRHLVNASAGLFSVNKFYGSLKSQGIRASKDSLHAYMEYLSDACLFFTVPVHTRSERSRQLNPRKVYAIDTGLVHACARRVSPDWSHLLENFVFLQIRRQEHLIEYVRTAHGHEVDFLVSDQQGRRMLVQVCAVMTDSKTREREFRALVEAMDEMGMSSATVVSLEDEGRYESGEKTIRIVPAWRWALLELERGWEER